MYGLCSLLGWLVGLCRAGLQAGLSANLASHTIETMLNIFGGTVLGGLSETVINGILGYYEGFKWILVWLLNVC